MKKSVIILNTIIYNAIEYYQNIIYGFLSIILSSMFFPSHDIRISIFASLATFSAGFLAKPFGGLIFGYYGDKYGRKSTITFSIVLMSLPTFIIGILPTYNEIGIASSIILIACRLLQGLSVGGQAYGRVIFVIEHSLKERANLAFSLLASSGLVGAIIGTSIGSLCFLNVMPIWAWRIPFLLGGLFGFIGYFLMRNVDETEEHKNAQRMNILKQNPIMDVIKHYLNNFLCVIGISAASLIPFYIISIYMIEKVFILNFGFSYTQIMITITFFMFIWAILLPLMGYLSDYIGEVITMKVFTLALLVFSFPLCWIIQESTYLPLTLLTIGVLCVLNAGYVAPSGTVMTKLFPVSVRCSGIAVASGIGSALFGGTAPLIGSILVENTGMLVFLAFYVMFGCLIGYIALAKAKFNVEQHKNVEDSDRNIIDQALDKSLTVAQAPSFQARTSYKKVALAAREPVIVNDLDHPYLQPIKNSVSESHQKKLGWIGKISIQIKSFDHLTSSELYNILKLRQDIFIIEQKITYDDIDGKDFQSIHVWCHRKVPDNFLAYLRIVPNERKSEVSIGRVLTIPNARGHGIASQLIKNSIEFILAHYPTYLLKLSAQEYLCPFYESLGFVKKGPVFYYPESDPIPNIPMIYTGFHIDRRYHKNRKYEGK